jgi:hypothetical protein
MTAIAEVAPLLEQPPTAPDVDRLAMQFLELEKKVDEAYKSAVELDESHERMRENLVCLVEEFGSTHAEKSKLLGIQYECMAEPLAGFPYRSKAMLPDLMTQPSRIVRNGHHRSLRRQAILSYLPVNLAMVSPSLGAFLLE